MPCLLGFLSRISSKECQKRLVSLLAVLYSFSGVIVFCQANVLANSAFLFTKSFTAFIASQHVVTCEAKKLILVFPFH